MYDHELFVHYTASIIDLSERMDYIHDTGDGSLDSWY